MHLVDNEMMQLSEAGHDFEPLVIKRYFEAF